MTKLPSREAVLHDATIMFIAVVRQSVKNSLIVRALRDHASFDEAIALRQVSDAFEQLAVEKDEDVRALTETISATRSRPGKATHPSDYRARDRPALERRRSVSKTLASRLRGLAADNDLLTRVLMDARELALDEIASAQIATVTPDAQTEDERIIALAQLADDLEEMLGDAKNL